MQKLTKELKNNILSSYLKLKSLRNASRENKVGLKTVKKVLIEENYLFNEYERPYSKSKIEIGTKINRWVIVGDYIKDEKTGRYLIPVKCECGTEMLLRPNILLRNSSFGCKHCVSKNNYPTFRKSRACPNEKLEGLSVTWLTSIKNNRKRGITREIKVAIDDFDLLKQLKKQNFKCAYSGVELKVLNINRKESNASIDRIDSLKDYTVDNIQWVHKDINRMKNSLPEDKFLEFCTKIHLFRHDNTEPSSTNS